MPIIEHSPSNRSRCRVCKKQIRKDELRYCEGFEKVYSQKWHHIKCYGDKWGLNSNRIINPEDRTYIQGWSKISKAEQLQVRRSFWPNEVDDDMKPSLRLTKEIDKMTVKELKLELQKRGKSIKLPRIGWFKRKRSGVTLKNLLQYRLKKYFIQNEHLLKQYQIKDNEKLVTGYIKQQNKELKIQVPVVLTSLITQFCPYQSMDILKAMQMEIYDQNSEDFMAKDIDDESYVRK